MFQSRDEPQLSVIIKNKGPIDPNYGGTDDQKLGQFTTHIRYWDTIDGVLHKNKNYIITIL